MEEPEAQAGAIRAHIAGDVVPLGYLVGPVVAYLLKRHEHALLDEQRREAIHLQISVMFYRFSHTF